MHSPAVNLNVENIEDSIQTLTEFANEPHLTPLIAILEALKQDINSEALLAQLIDTWRNLGIYQGTVLTYLPHFYTLIPDDIFGENG
ncbi:MAG: hypothetical protein OEY29_07810 [Gammaproteobacteria bacterium]|nr:hypothetical protein [Gammaproteobacteria bacterium]